jgi:predicted small secreted protein
MRHRLLGPALVVLLTGTLAACNSSSGTSQKPSGGGSAVTGAEVPTAGAKQPAKGTIAEALAQTLKRGQ